jgi:hypothetical protein
MNTFAKAILGWGLVLHAGLTQASLVTTYSPSSQEPGAYPAWSASFTFSKNGASALKFTQADVLPEGSTTTTSTVQEQSGASKPYETKRVDMALDSVTSDTSTGKIIQYVASGGFSLTLGPSGDLQVGGGRLVFHDLWMSVAPDGQASVYGDLTGQSLGGASMTYQGLIWTSVAEAGQGSPNPNSGFVRLFPDVTLPQLVFDASAFAVVTDAFGLNPEGLAYSAFRSAAGNFGRLTVSSVPEPGTHALLGLGLFAMGVLARR